MYFCAKALAFRWCSCSDSEVPLVFRLPYFARFPSPQISASTPAVWSFCSSSIWLSILGSAGGCEVGGLLWDCFGMVEKERAIHSTLSDRKASQRV